MTKCNRKKQLLGKSIRNVRMRRNMTQRALAKATDGVSESALRSYELGERSPKQDALERIAKALDVAPACFDTYGIFILTMPMPSSRKMGRKRICNA